jgi:MFS family permease
MSLRHYYNYHSHFTKFFDNDLHLFELSVWVQAFALSLVSVFVPIILWNIGLDIKSIVGFYLLFNAIDVPLNFVAQRFIELYGARTALIVAIFCELAFFTTLFTMDSSFWHILVLAICLAVFDTFYWVGHLYIFVQAARKNSLIRDDIGMLRVIRMVGGICAPFIGAMILIIANQQTLIFIAGLCMALSLIPLFKMRRLKFIPQEKSLSPDQVLSAPRERVNYGSEVLVGVKAELEDTIWPFFVFLTFASITTVSYLPMIVSFAGLIIVFVTAHFSLKRRVYTFVSSAAFLIALTWIFRMGFYDSKIFVIASAFLVAIIRLLIEVPLEVNIFERSKRIGALASVTYLNMSRMLGRALLYLILFSVFIFSSRIDNTGLYFATAFVVVIFAMLILSFVGLKVHSKEQEHDLI